MNHELLKFEVPEIIYGCGALSRIGECAGRLGGERVLLVSDPGVIRAGWADECIKHLEKEDLKYVMYDNVVTNPRDYHVEQGIQAYLQNECDVIVALGGGSPIDTAKGIAVLAANHGKIHDYEGCNLIHQPVPPMVCAPTTAGAGADVSQFAVIQDSTRKKKMTILSRVIMPNIALIDPLLLETKPPDLIAATGMDALSHAIEAYVSCLSWALTEPHALHAIELVFRHLPQAVNSKDIHSLEGMSVASLEAGISFSNAILGAVHALSHPIGGVYDAHHGLINSILLPAVVKRNIRHAVPKYAAAARAMGVNTRKMTEEQAARHVPEKIQELVMSVHLPTRLAQIGVNRRDLPMLAETAVNDLCMLTNPYCFSVEEVIAVYEEVF